MHPFVPEFIQCVMPLPNTLPHAMPRIIHINSSRIQRPMSLCVSREYLPDNLRRFCSYGNWEIRSPQERTNSEPFLFLLWLVSKTDLDSFSFDIRPWTVFNVKISFSSTQTALDGCLSIRWLRYWQSLSLISLAGRKQSSSLWNIG